MSEDNLSTFKTTDELRVFKPLDNREITQKIGGKWAEGLLITLINNTLMSEKKSGNKDEKAKEVTAIKKVDFDQLPEKEQRATLETIVNAKKPTVDKAALMTELQRNKIDRIPSDELISMAIDARKQFAEGLLAFLDAKAVCNNIYNAAVKDGYTGPEAAKIVRILVHSSGAMLSDKTIRRYLPEEAKDLSKGSKDEPRVEAKEKAPEEKEGLKNVILPPAAIEWVVKHAERIIKDGGCVVWIRSAKTYTKMGFLVKVENAPAIKK